MKSSNSAAFYRHLHTGNAGDIEFYLRAATGADTVLELGCGGGRVAGELLRDGHAVTGVDLVAEHIEEARAVWGSEPRASFILADMRDLELKDDAGVPLQFDRIFVPYTTLYALGGRSGVLACLRCAERHLASGGELWGDVYPMDDLHAALLDGELPPEDDDEPVAVFGSGVDEVRVLEQSSIDASTQRVQVTYRALDARGDEVERLEMCHDYLLLPELLELFEEAGLSPIALSGDFDGNPVDDDPEFIVFGLERASTAS
jgi:SAM-dependent methyltransferase